MSQAYQQLTATFTRLHHLDHLLAMASWDSMTMMPAGGGKARSEAITELDLYRHMLLTDKQIASWLRDAKMESLSEEQQANLVEMERVWQKSALLPATLVEAKTLAGARCEQAWRKQRPANDWHGFAENLREVVKISREEARIYAEASGCSAYDALLAKYEPGMTRSTLDILFADIKSWLPELIEKAMVKQGQRTVIVPEGPFDIAAQKKLSLDIMSLLKFDFNSGRLDVSAHPFCGGVPDDVRITTRYRQDEFISAMMGVIHETGHARYEQNLPKQWISQPIGQARSTAIHESQSLFFEKQLGRSEAFLSLVLPSVRQQFGEHAAWQPANFLALNQRVQPGLIRVDADEVSYPAHIIVRYEIEKALIDGDIEVDDIPALWQETMQALLGLDTTGNYRDGCMQDIHWTDGSFGYFPTYTLGAMYAAQLYQAMNQALPNLTSSLADGDLQPVFDWLHQHIWQHGSRFSTASLIQQATGEALNPHWYRQHLENRYL